MHIVNVTTIGICGKDDYDNSYRLYLCGTPLSSIYTNTLADFKAISKLFQISLRQLCKHSLMHFGTPFL